MMSMPYRWQSFVSALAVVAVLSYAMVHTALASNASTYSPNETQKQLMAFAWAVGEPHDLSLAMVGILLQESLAGKYGPVGDHGNGFGGRAYGAMQVKLSAARDALNHCPSLGNYRTGEEIIARLINDPYWNIRVGGCYLALLDQRGGDDLSWRELITSYNRGLSGARLVDGERHPYVIAVVDRVTDDGIAARYREEIERRAAEFEVGNDLESTR